MKQLAAYLFILIFFSFSSKAQQLDSSFAINGYTQDNGFLANVTSIAIQPDDKIVAALDRSASQNNSLDFFACRYKTNGTLDSTFGTNGISHAFAGAKSISRDIALQADGKIVVAGQATYCNQIVCGFDNFVMERLKANGQPDSSFGQDGFVKCGPVFGPQVMAGAASRVKVLASGKILVSGMVTYQVLSGMAWYAFVVRFNTNGSVDNTFGTNGIMQTGMGTTDMFATLADMAIDNNGNIYCTGRKSYTGINLPNPGDGYVFKINASGVLDNSFGTNGVALLNKAPWDDPSNIMLRSDGRILIAGVTRAAATLDSPGSGAVYMLEANGAQSSIISQGYRSFTVPGKPDMSVRSMVMYANNKFSLSGFADSNYHKDAFIARFNADGTNDNSFNNGSNIAVYNLSVSGTLFHSMKELSNGKLLLAGGRNIMAPTLKPVALVARLKAPSANSIHTVSQNNTAMISIYPNPAQDKIFISYDVAHAGAQVQVHVADITGKAVYQYSGMLQQLERDMNSWFAVSSKGMYVIQLSGNENYNQSLKLVKQ